MTLRSRAARVRDAFVRVPSPTGATSVRPVRTIVLLTADMPGQCRRYRVDAKRALAARAGLTLKVVHVSDPRGAMSALKEAQLLIVYRVSDGGPLRRIVRTARRRGVPVVFETDDAVHDRAAVAANPNLSTLPTELAEAVITGADGYRAALEMCDHALASTPALAESLARHVPGRAWVVSNGLDDETLEIARQLGTMAHTPGVPVRIVYGSGSRAHDADFALVVPALIDLLDSGAAELAVIGPVSLPPELDARSVTQLPELDYAEYLAELARADIAIAPLLDLPFNHGKSDVKWLEASALKVAFAGSAVVYGDTVEDGRTGVIVDRPGDWPDSLAQLVADDDMRRSLAAAAHEAVSDRALGGRPMRELNEFVVEVSR